MITRAQIIEQATSKQLEASDPQANVFVRASAGSGKTTLLVDRLLRLMLPHIGQNGQVVAGTDPEYILCLTFTRSGAAEMAMKLQTRLGRWVALDDDALDAQLDRLRVPSQLPKGVDDEGGGGKSYRRLCARRLFFQIVDLPTGMRIDTIHAFCQSILRSFPVEAAINPRFTLMEEADVKDNLRLSVARTFGVIKNARYITPLARQIRWRSFEELIDKCHGQSNVRQFVAALGRSPERIWNRLCQILGVSPNFLEIDEESYKRQSLERLLHNFHIKELAQELYTWNATVKKGKTIANLMGPLLRWFSSDEVKDTQAIQTALRKAFLTKEWRLNKQLKQAATQCSPSIGEKCEEIAAQLQEVKDTIASRQIIKITYEFFSLMYGILSDYEQCKLAHMQVEYPDLIRKTLSLLSVRADAQWVMYKLDGGIEHILLDEVQDTSPTQWDIVSQLSADFFAGEGAYSQSADAPTLFAVGDGKQSIYSFQGADLSSFQRWHEKFRRLSTQAARRWVEPDLSVSFRSTTPILAFVDQVFALDEAAEGVVSQDKLVHQSANPEDGGVVELWPLIKGEEVPQLDPFSAITPQENSYSPKHILARKIADYIDKLVRQDKVVKPEDILVLLPARDDFSVHLTRALQSHHLSIANLMSRHLTDALAVQDMLSLCHVLLFPDDDLKLAEILTSPIGDLSDDDLMALAHRGPQARLPNETLWHCLARRHRENSAWHAVFDMLGDLLNHADFMTPYQLMMRALDHFGARTRFARRLGRMALEQLDSLLLQAVSYQQSHPSSLQGFVDWLERSEKEIKPEAERVPGAIRLMTAHKSKGMEADFVILPYTTKQQPKSLSIIWDSYEDMDIPFFVPSGQDSSISYTQNLKQEKKAREQRESNRLLYVALTRAKRRLLICGWSGKNSPKVSWYKKCMSAFEVLHKKADELAETHGLQVHREGEGEQARYLIEKPFLPQRRSPASSSEKNVHRPLPSWMGQAPDYRPVPPVHEEKVAQPLVPSRPDDRVFGTLPGARSPLKISASSPKKSMSALKRGEIVHSLLQFLPTIAPARREEVAQSWLGTKKALSSESAELAKKVAGVTLSKSIEPLFSSAARSEQRITGQLASGRVISGQVDRLVVLPDRVLVCDYKTGRRVPRDVSKTPENYVRQMVAYRQVLRALWPDREVECFLIWIDAVRIDRLPQELMDACRFH